MSVSHKLSLVPTKPLFEKALDNALGHGEVLLFCTEEDQESLLNKAKQFGPAVEVNNLDVPISEARAFLFHRYDALPEEVQLHLIAAKASGALVMSALEYFDTRLGFTEIELLTPTYFMRGFGPLSSGAKRAVKRVNDIISVLMLLIITSPLMAIFAVLIKLESKGPVFFSQTRTGRFGREFKVVKFRSMVVDAEKNGAQWAVTNDPRVTRIGRFIRATRIDELPQLLNVLRGEMSFVGPRPERPVFIEQLEHQVPFYNFRHSVKPGITGYAQVKYPYGASVEDAKWKHRYDIYYIKHQSMWFDLRIIFLTVKVVLFRMGR